MNTNKALLALVIGMGVVILLALVALAIGLTQRAQEPSAGFFAKSGAPASTAAARGDLTVAIPPGSSVVSVDRSGELLMVHIVDEDDRSTLLFIDPADGRVVRRIAFSTRR